MKGSRNWLESIILPLKKAERDQTAPQTKIKEKVKMERLSNAFSVLELDADDNQLQVPCASTSTPSKPDEGKGKKKVNGFDGNEMQNQQSTVIPAVEYKLPLVWIDLEMTGLDIEVDRIIEIACIVTDGNLTKSMEGPNLVIHQSKDCLDRMGEWCQNHHVASGLTDKVLQSKITERDAEMQDLMTGKMIGRAWESVGIYILDASSSFPASFACSSV
ncbi:RNase_T domain-containing protein [Cephalotus follicularis]|uniref:RNase_T domain-containing protein n=1 Tax=Cephalotus follicularis TaxID=3775 RepID=A0A1Q3CBZ4_CEPFO|nr:RNase_T domain-containing protein [Cephalotus follicularis]